MTIALIPTQTSRPRAMSAGRSGVDAAAMKLRVHLKPPSTGWKHSCMATCMALAAIRPGANHSM